MNKLRICAAGVAAGALCLALAPASWAGRAEPATTRAVQAGPVPVHVITWNIGGETSKNWIADRVSGYSGNGVKVIFGAQQVDGQEQYQKILDALNTKKPGVVWSGRLLCPGEPGDGCDAFFTDGQVQSYLNHKFNDPNHPEEVPPAASGRHVQGAIDARIDVGGGVVVNYCVTHLESGQLPGKPYEQQINAANPAQARDLATWLGSAPTTIVSGDLNAVPFDTTRAYPQLVPQFTDSWTSSDPGYTTPTSGPNQRIDYVLYSPVGVQPLGDQLLTEWSQHGNVGSDHLPLLADFNVTS